MARRNSDAQADRPNLRAPTQSRSRESTEALLAIGKRLIAEHGVDGCNMPDVAAAAGSSVGALYFRFGNKEKFVSEIMKRHVEQSHIDLAKVLARIEDFSRHPKRCDRGYDGLGRQRSPPERGLTARSAPARP